MSFPYTPMSSPLNGGGPRWSSGSGGGTGPSAGSSAVPVGGGGGGGQHQPGGGGGGGGWTPFGTTAYGSTAPYPGGTAGAPPGSYPPYPGMPPPSVYPPVYPWAMQTMMPPPMGYPPNPWPGMNMPPMPLGMPMSAPTPFNTSTSSSSPAMHTSPSPVMAATAVTAGSSGAIATPANIGAIKTSANLGTATMATVNGTHGINVATAGSGFNALKALTHPSPAPLGTRARQIEISALAAASSLAFKRETESREALYARTSQMEAAKAAATVAIAVAASHKQHESKEKEGSPPVVAVAALEPHNAALQAAIEREQAAVAAANAAALARQAVQVAQAQARSAAARAAPVVAASVRHDDETASSDEDQEDDAEQSTSPDLNASSPTDHRVRGEKKRKLGGEQLPGLVTAAVSPNQTASMLMGNYLAKSSGASPWSLPMGGLPVTPATVAASSSAGPGMVPFSKRRKAVGPVGPLVSATIATVLPATVQAVASAAVMGDMSDDDDGGADDPDDSAFDDGDSLSDSPVPPHEKRVSGILAFPPTNGGAAAVAAAAAKEKDKKKPWYQTGMPFAPTGGAPLLPINAAPGSALAAYQQHMGAFAGQNYTPGAPIPITIRNARRIGADRRRRAKLKEALNSLREIIIRHGQDATNFDQVSVLYSSVDLMHTFETMIEHQHALLQTHERTFLTLNRRIALYEQCETKGSAASSAATIPVTTASSIATAPTLYAAKHRKLKKLPRSTVSEPPAPVHAPTLVAPPQPPTAPSGLGSILQVMNMDGMRNADDTDVDDPAEEDDVDEDEEEEEELEEESVSGSASAAAAQLKKERTSDEHAMATKTKKDGVEKIMAARNAAVTEPAAMQ